MKYLWLLLPVATMFLVFYICIEVLPSGFQWYAMPTILALILAQALSIVVAVVKSGLPKDVANK